jgi:hypothetical protein
VSAKRLTQFLTELSCPNLRTLSLEFPLSDEAATAIAQNAACSSLTTLVLSDRNRQKEETLSDRGLSQLLTSKSLQQLVQLELSCPKPEKTAALLSDRKVLPNLRYLRLPVSDALRDKLRKARPSLGISTM